MARSLAPRGALAARRGACGAAGAVTAAAGAGRGAAPGAPVWGCLLQSRLRPSNPTRSGNRCPQHSVIQERHSPALTAARPSATPGGGRADLGRATPWRSALWRKGTDAGDRVSGPTGRTSVGSQAQGRPLRNCVSTAPRSRLGRHGAGLPPGRGLEDAPGGTAPSPVPAAVRAPRAHAPVAVSAATGEVWAHGGLRVTRPRLKSPRRVWR